MNVSVLGGGSEVGASCLFINIGDTNILIDAGMRMHGDDLLPSLGMLEGLGCPDVILVTHAHADHIGALPIVHSLFPSIPIYANPPTFELMKVMMKDSYKIMETRSRENHTLVPYTEEQVNTLLESVLFFPANGVLHVGSTKITSFRAGHILGAVMFFIETAGESILVTGDLSFKAGRTIPGAQVPHGIRPDVVVMESTYGNRAHTDRNTEERRLADDVAEVIGGGGFALIPAFALGRAQEVLLVLQDYMEKGLIPEFPIYVDGLVTPISHIYNRFPHFLKGPVAHRINRNGDVFFTEGRCKAVHPKEREKILGGKPGCIIASSGMLTGGASSWYAERIVSGEKNAIFITGYQDEESPGKKLLNLAEGIEDSLELNGTSYQVKCRIGKYGLSAHADANEMNRFIQTLEPTYTLLVHGDDDARVSLGELIDQRYHPVLVENGQTYPFEKRKSGKGITGKRYKVNEEAAALREKVGKLILYRLEQEKPYKIAICTGIHPKTNSLTCLTLKGKQLKIPFNQATEILGTWNGPIDELKQVTDQVFSYVRPYLEKINWNRLPEHGMSLDEIFQILKLTEFEEQLAAALALNNIPKEKRYRDKDGRNIYQVDANIKRKLDKLELPIQGLKLNPAAAMETVRTLMADHPRFIRCGADGVGTTEERLTLYFDFPGAISEEERKELERIIIKNTGWSSAISNSVRQDLLQTQLFRLFGPALGTPSVHLNERKVIVASKKPDGTEPLVEKFKEMTGFQLIFQGESTSVSQTESTEIFHVDVPSKRLENNQAIEEAKKWAADRGITIYKTGIKQQNGQAMMEVHFISPEIAMRHQVDLEELSYRIGMPVTYAKNPKQNEIIRITLESLPETWETKKNPSIHMDRRSISIKLVSLPNEEEQKEISEKIQKQTGYSLEVTV